ncbi:hypothetical protein GBN32_00340 [Plesiomonas shigelloides]|uniref:plasmid partitioning/stability family protein n=1 Tax=Plesiomonas shigelloides TaxID=703 RepID=UPI0012626B14|nr:plasmid partitioning/stability family protein [Plesiomonas shigelloides]KAB7715721.1 hypothetical protein GBN32_00340 [Plesiomonas shigelloides]
MSKSVTRRISFYLNPEQVRSEKNACDILDNMTAAERGRMQRAAMMAGLALMQLDPRLPHLLAELMAGPVDAEAVHCLIDSVLPTRHHEIKSSAPIRSHQVNTLDTMRKNAASLFPR